ncbi:3-deoxy-manno-octulosonate cytidylyltransferase [Alphaproteobacteria bacterium]|nr:3-deoxy-manno-octulosonate cytidylyltransferase [Alphaproteobacteria bacterium]
MKTIIVIPARMASQRFPNKPMALIDGKPMIQRVWEKAKIANIGDVVVACCEKIVFDKINSIGGKAIMTDFDLPSGTDRIYKIIDNYPNANQFECIINLQGDMPLVNPNDIQKVRIPLMQGFDIGTLVTSISQEEERNINITKAKVNWIKRDNIGEAIDFYKKPKKVLKNIYHHIGIYSYRIRSLKKFVNLKPSENELYHKLEQWRALDSNMTIGTKYIDESYFGVDTEEDLLKAENIIKNKK